MKEKIKQYIYALMMERAHIKQILKVFEETLTEDEKNDYLDKLTEIKGLIDKLRKGLK